MASFAKGFRPDNMQYKEAYGRAGSPSMIKGGQLLYCDVAV